MPRNVDAHQREYQVMHVADCPHRMTHPPLRFDGMNAVLREWRDTTGCEARGCQIAARSCTDWKVIGQ